MRAEGIYVRSEGKEGRNVPNIFSKNGMKYQPMVYKLENTNERDKNSSSCCSSLVMFQIIIYSCFQALYFRNLSVGKIFL